jgi:hypothetical protein
VRVVLERPPGLNGDDTTFAASGRWADGSNVRFREGKFETIGGWELLTTTALTGVCRTVFGWTNTDAELNIAFGTNTKLQLWYDSTVYDITPSSGFTPGAADGTGGAGYGTGAYSVGDYSEPSTAAYYPLTWSLSAWGQNLIANPRGQTIFAWTNNTASPAAALSNAPDECTYALVAPTRQVFALGCSAESGGVFDPLIIRHSSVGDNNEWNTAANTTAREYRLTGGGRIVGGRVMGQAILIWTTEGLWLASYVGSLTNIWSISKVGSQCGLIGPNAAIVVGQQAYWIGPDLQIYTYALGGGTRAVNCPILRGFSDNLASAQGDKIVASSNGRFSEIRFDYPDSRDGNENNRYIAAHVPTLNADGQYAWYRGDMARTAFVDAPPHPIPTYPLAVDDDGYVYWHDKGTSADGAAFSWYIETADNYISPDVNAMVRQVQPDFKNQQGPVFVDVTTKFAPQGDATTVTGSPMAPGDRKSDVRATGRVIRVKFYGNSSPTFCRGGNPTVDYTPAGGR